MKRHLSSEEISRWTIGERPAEIARHAMECLRCREELDRLEDTFSLFRESGIRWSDRCYAARYGVEWQPELSSPAPMAHRGGRPLLPWACALAASVLLGGVLLLRPAPPPQQAQVPDRRGDEPFVEIPYVAPLAPYERAEVTRMDVPVTALIAAGFEVHVADMTATVRADVLFGQDGRAHAIRLIPDSLTNSDRRLYQ